MLSARHYWRVFECMQFWHSEIFRLTCSPFYITDHMLDCWTCGTLLYQTLWRAASLLTQDVGPGQAVCLISWWCLSLIHLHLQAAGCDAYPGIIVNFCLTPLWRAWIKRRRLKQLPGAVFDHSQTYIECIYGVASKYISFSLKITFVWCKKKKNCCLEVLTAWSTFIFKKNKVNKGVKNVLQIVYTSLIRLILMWATKQ